MEIQKTKVVYSALMGNYDYIKDPVKVNPAWRYVMFVDQHFTGVSDYWEFVVVKSNRPPAKAARHVKLQPHKYFDFDYAVWVDSSTTIGVDPDELVEALIGKDGPDKQPYEHELLMKIHPDRKNCYIEVARCIDIKKAPIPALKKQAETYLKDGFTYELAEGTLKETGAFCVKNTPKVIELFDMWWKQVSLHTTRDQIALPYVLWKMSQAGKMLTLVNFTHNIYCRWFALVNHREPAPQITVNYLTPYAIDGNLGKAYNEAVLPYNDEDWICLMDGDTFFPESSYGQRITKLITDNPGIDVFGCTTNRLRDSPQLFRQQINHDKDMGQHEYISELLWLKHGTDTKRADRPIAGLFMLAKAKVFKDLKFKNGLFWIDTDFGYRSQEKGYKTAIALGIYVVHFYRMNVGIDSVDHLK